MAAKKVGVMGGSFNPIHMGHLLLAEWVKEECGLDQILFIPAGCPYMKEGTELASGEDRLQMVLLAIEGIAEFSASSMEIARGGYTYTYETMEQLSMEAPDTEYSFIMGADCLFKMEYWKSPDRILKSCRLIAAARNGANLDEMKEKAKELENRFGGQITVVAFPEVAVSSTDIRERIKKKKSIRFLVPELVQKYMTDRGLYEEHGYTQN